MNVLSLFSGVGGIDLGLEAAGMTTVAFCEIDPHARSVLRRHWPDVPIYEDVRDVAACGCVRRVQHDDDRRRDAHARRGRGLRPTDLRCPDCGGVPRGRVDLVCGGFPCQDISVAGRREGLAGERSGLWWEFHRILSELTPAWCLIENVDGLRSSNDGRDLGAILGALGDLGYGWSYRVLDARFFGVPQRRRRVFIVGHLGDGRAAQVLLEPEGRSGDSPACGEAGQVVAGDVGGCTEGGGYIGSLTTAFDAKNYSNLQEVLSGSVIPVGVSENQRGEVLLTEYVPVGFGWSNAATQGDDVVVDGTGPLRAKMQPGVVYPIDLRNALRSHGDTGVGTPGTGIGEDGDPSPTLGTSVVPGVAYPLAMRGRVDGAELEMGEADTYNALRAGDGGSSRANTVLTPDLAVRRLTPRECERLMGWPDDHTRWNADGQEIADSHRYRMCGNGVVAPVAEWIGRRIMAVVS